jgi:peptidyl-prolyl cis-trans isomerase SurA
MQKGDTSDVIRSPSGFHIIKLKDVRSTEQHVVTQTQARHILIRPDELISGEDAQARLHQLLLRVKGGDDFADLARGHSNDTVSAADGGSLGWVSPGDLVPEFEAVMNDLAPGQLSIPFKTQFGYHVVQVLERREHDSTEDVKRAKAREAIRQRKLEEAHQNWLREIRDDAYVEYRLEG